MNGCVALFPVLLDFPPFDRYNYPIEPVKETTMKRLIVLILALAIALSLAACGCSHTAGDWTLISADTKSLTATWEQPCTQCGKVMDTKETSTGVAPENGLMPLSPEDWFSCFTTVIQNYGANQTLMPVEPEAQEDALLFSVVNLSGLKTAISFYDKDGNVITKEHRSSAGNVHSIHIQAQFTNESAPQFYIMLALLAITNNSELTNEDASLMADRIMGGLEVANNGYIYQMAITSVEDQTVMLIINAE